MRVLLATDASDCAEVALDLVAAVEWPAASTIHLLQAVATGTLVFGGPWPPVTPVDQADIEADIRQRAQEHLDTAARRLERPGLSTETSVVGGRAADVIHAQAKRLGTDLIVVGSRGHGTLESMLLGSTSSEVVDHASVPVLVARARAMGSVVFAYDGSGCAEDAAAFLISSGIFADARIHVVSIADAAPPHWTDMGLTGADAAADSFAHAAEPSRSQHQQLARTMAERLQTVGLDARPERRDGDPAEQIVRAADTHGAGLIVVGTHGRTGLRRLLMGSVARNVLHHAHCSVLVVHSRPAAEAAA